MPLILGCLFSGAVNAEWHRHDSDVFGTSFSLELWSPDQERANQAIHLVVQEMWRIHHMLSPYEETSELSKVNLHAHKQPLTISAELTELLEKSIAFGQLTGGAFDISYASIGRYYDYHAGQQPSPELIEQLKQSINYRKIDLDIEQQSVQLGHPEMTLDLGGIAKGYAMDRAADIMISMGIENATVSAGGDMRVLGDKRGRPWIIGIRNPRQEETAIRLPLDNVAVSTSGDYERFFIDDQSGARVHHILDPGTGKSAAKLASVTLIGERGLDTDPLSTSVFVLGVEKGLELINRMPEFDAILIDVAGQVHFSQGLVSPE